MIPALFTSATRIGAFSARTLHVAERTFSALVLLNAQLDGGDLEPVEVILPLQVLVLVLDHVLTRGVPHARVVGRRGGVSVDVHLAENAGRIGERSPRQLPSIVVSSKTRGKAKLARQRPGHLSLVRPPLRFSLSQPVNAFNANKKEFEQLNICNFCKLTFPMSEMKRSLSE